MAKVCPFCGAEFDENQVDSGRSPGTLVCPTCFQELDGPEAPAAAGQPVPPAGTPGTDPARPLQSETDQSAPPGPDSAPPMPEIPIPPRPPEPAHDAPASGPWTGPESPNPCDCDAPPPYTGDPGDAPAWERDGSFMARIWATVWQVLLHPVRTMGAPPLQDGLGAPLAFGVILGTFGGIVMAFWQRVLPVQGMEAAASLWHVILLPLTNLAGIFVTAGVTHVFLWLFRASRRGFKGTFRAVAYANAANLFFIIPSLGMMAAGVWGFVCLVGGLSGAQATGKARVFFALLTPLVLLVVLLAVLAFFFGLGAIFGAAGIMQQQGGSFSF